MDQKERFLSFRWLRKDSTGSFSLSESPRAESQELLLKDDPAESSSPREKFSSSSQTGHRLFGFIFGASGQIQSSTSRTSSSFSIMLAIINRYIYTTNEAITFKGSRNKIYTYASILKKGVFWSSEKELQGFGDIMMVR